MNLPELALDPLAIVAFADVDVASPFVVGESFPSASFDAIVGVDAVSVDVPDSCVDRLVLLLLFRAESLTLLLPFRAESLTRCFEKHMLAIVLDRCKCIEASIWKRNKNG